jgi:hypothetical protein
MASRQFELEADPFMACVRWTMKRTAFTSNHIYELLSHFRAYDEAYRNISLEEFGDLSERRN